MDEQEMTDMTIQLILSHSRADLSIDDGSGALLLGSTSERATKTALWIGVGVFAIASIVICALILYQATSSITPHLTRDTSLILQQTFVTIPQAANCKKFLATLTEKEHIAGSEQDRRLASWTEELYGSFGLSSEVFEYQVLLSYPQKMNVSLIEPRYYSCATAEPPIASDPTSSLPELSIAWNGYSADGEVTSYVVYVNYGTKEDFDLLEQLNITLEGNIALARYGRVYRGTKVLLAQERGMVGVLLYSDPGDDGSSRGSVYPEGPYRPESSVQRGSVMFDQFYPGDPQTPGVPSLKVDMERLPLNRTNIPKIPVAPLGYKDAKEILSALGGGLPAVSWKGGLDINYRIGPGPAQVALEVRASFPITPIWNVVGTLKGYDDKKKVIIGSHRDGWTVGAVDSSIGCAIVLEVARSLAHLQEIGKWTPRRSIQFVSWDAEEYGLTGSVEWVEHFRDRLLQSTVAYLNADAPVTAGLQQLTAASSPVLWSVIRSAAKLVPSAPGSAVSMYDKWLSDQRSQAANTSTIVQPKFEFLGSGSDFTGFYSHLLIPSAGLDFGTEMNVYHSIYDSFAYFEKFVDPSFEISATLTKLFGIILMKIADDLILPFDYVEYGLLMTSELDQVRRAAPQLNFTLLETAIHNFAMSAFDLSERVKVLQQTPLATIDMTEVNRINDKLMQGERQFARSDGLKGRSWYKHPLFATPVYEGYAGFMYPDLWQSIWDNDMLEAQAELERLAVDVQRAAAFLAK